MSGVPPLFVQICCRDGFVVRLDRARAEDTFTPRLQTPRVAPLTKEKRTPAQQEMLASRPDYNVYKTLAQHVDLYNRWSPLGRFVMTESSLPPREREMVMLRMGWLCQSEYEWAQHARIAKSQAGMTNEDIQRIAEGATAAGWSEFDRTLLRMVDELRYEAMISDATWQALRTKYSVQQVIEAMYTASQYQLVSMALNSSACSSIRASRIASRRMCSCRRSRRCRSRSDWSNPACRRCIQRIGRTNNAN